MSSRAALGLARRPALPKDGGLPLGPQIWQKERLWQKERPAPRGGERAVREVVRYSEFPYLLTTRDARKNGATFPNLLVTCKIQWLSSRASCKSLRATSPFCWRK